MVVGPTVIVGALGMIATVQSSAFMQKLSHYEPFGTILLMAGRLMPYVLVIGVFSFLYGFVPNTQVRIRATLIAGVIAGIAWTASGMILARVFSLGGGTMVIYAGFAIVIVALIWLHVSWLILLLGAQLSFYLQNPQYLRPGHGEIQLNASLRERVALSIMYLIVADYHSAKRRWKINDLADHLLLPGAALGPIVTALERKELLTLTEDDTWLPARDPATIELIDVLDAVRKDEAGPRLSRIRDVAPAVEAARAAELALKDSVKGKTVMDLLNT
jgi:membrane protein